MVELRQATERDRDFVWTLHKATLKDAVSKIWGWDERRQIEFFERRFDPEKLKIIMAEEEPIGVLQVEADPSQLFLDLIEIMPAWQGRRIGTAVVKDLQSRARRETMIRIFRDPEARAFLQQISRAETRDRGDVTRTVAEIIAAVRKRGDAAVRDYSIRFGDAVPDPFCLEKETIREISMGVPESSRKVLERAAENIRAFADAVVAGLQPVCLARDGFTVGMDYRPVDRVACYVPGGRHPLPSSALMTAVTARAAGVGEVSLVSPVLSPEIAYAGVISGVERYLLLGGAQVVAALAFGTESVPPQDMIVGPGNAYVTEAKRQLNGIVGIDILAGPSEVAIIADETADPEWIALDMLAQWEHDPLSQAWLLTDRDNVAEDTGVALEKAAKVQTLPAYIRNAIDNGTILVFDTLGECVSASDRLAPEHLQLAVADPGALKEKCRNYGALFLGAGTTVAFGDYMAGPNHTLPTNRTARFSGGLSPLSFLRPQSWLEVGEGRGRLARDTSAFARLEGLFAHAAASEARIDPCCSVQGSRK
ncbi:MAG: histidinol dehydrogenase [Planctomycetota bacterium]|jgi:histidinol dehydrogenase